MKKNQLRRNLSQSPKVILNEPEEKYSSLMDNACDAIILTDIDGYIIEVNKKAAAFLDYTKEELLSMSCNMLFPQENHKRIHEAFNKIILNSVGYLKDENVMTKTGKLIPCDIMSSLMAFGGEIVCQCIVRDISDRRHAENSLLLTQSQLQANLENTPNVAVQWYDADGRVIYWNPASETIYGWKSYEAIGKTLGSLILTPDEESEFMQILENIKKTGSPWGPGELSIHRKDGSLGWVLSTTFPIPMPDGSNGFSCMDVDITERKNSEALKEKLLSEQKDMISLITVSHQEWRDTFDSINDMIFVTDMNSTIIKANKAVSITLSLPFSEIIGAKCHKLFHGSDSFPDWCGSVQCKNTCEPVICEMYEQNLAMHIEIKTIPQKDVNGTLMGFIHVIRDITAYKKNEEHLRHAQRMEAVGQLAGSIAHDFNNVLTAIISSASLLSLKMDDNDSHMKQYVSYVLSASERGAALVKGLLAFSRKELFYPLFLSLNVVLKDIAPLLRRLVLEDTDLQINICDDIATVIADRMQIEQVIINIVANARDAMPSGGLVSITLDIICHQERLLNKYEAAYRVYPDLKQGYYAVISISDTGVGMDEKTKDKIFDPFFTTKEVGKGTGLGLSSAYGIIKQHNGSIHVYSKKDIGTTFKIYLPIATTGLEEHPHPEPAIPDGGHETILLAEDEPIVRDVIRILLEEFGYKVIIALDGNDAIEIFRENKDSINLVLIDIVMPKINGKEAYKKMKEIKPTMKTIFMSGYTADILKTRFDFTEGLYYISKPASPTDLLTMIRHVLDMEALT